MPRGCGKPCYDRRISGYSATLIAIGLYLICGSLVLAGFSSGYFEFFIFSICFSIVGSTFGIFGEINDGISLDQRALVASALLLPACERQEYLAEWRAWSLDMRKEGAPWHRQWIEILSLILVAAPCLAIRIRLTRQGTGE
jgi:hypothetical protein